MQAIQRHIPGFRLHQRWSGYWLFLRSLGSSFITSVGAQTRFSALLWEKIFPYDFSLLVEQKMPCFRPLSGRFCAVLLRLNQLCIRGIIERDHRRFSKTLFAAADQAAAFQLLKDPRDALPTAVQLLLCLLYGEIQSDRAVRIDVTVDLGNTGSVQHECVQHLCVVGKTSKAILHEKPRKRYVRCR